MTPPWSGAETSQWVTEEAVAAWYASATGHRGGQMVYSDPAIETGLAFRPVLHQPLHQTEGALRSIADLLDVEIRNPDHTTFSCRGGGLTIMRKRLERVEPSHVLVYSTASKFRGSAQGLLFLYGGLYQRNTATDDLMAVPPSRVRRI